jgi:nucleotide-binding universal stress UspA family protein
MPETIKKILCATDLTAASEPAIRSAINLARQLDVPLVLLHTVEQPYRTRGFFIPFTAADEEFMTGLTRREEEAAIRLMGEQLAQLNPPGSAMVNVDIAIRRGIPADAIAQAARELGADLLVVGTHARTGLQHALLGSVAERLVRFAPCQVLVVRQNERRSA